MPSFIARNYRALLCPVKVTNADNTVAIRRPSCDVFVALHGSSAYPRLELACDLNSALISLDTSPYLDIL